MISITKQHPILIALSNYGICYLQQRSQSRSVRTIIPILQMKNIEVSRDEVINPGSQTSRAETRSEVFLVHDFPRVVYLPAFLLFLR